MPSLTNKDFIGAIAITAVAGVKVTQRLRVTPTSIEVVDHRLTNVVNFTAIFVNHKGTSSSRISTTLFTGVVKLVRVFQNPASQLFGTNSEIIGGRCPKGTVSSSVSRKGLASSGVSKARGEHKKGIARVWDDRPSEAFIPNNKTPLNPCFADDNHPFIGNFGNADKTVLLIKPDISGEKSIKARNNSLPSVPSLGNREHHETRSQNFILKSRFTGNNSSSIQHSERDHQREIFSVHRVHICRNHTFKNRGGISLVHALGQNPSVYQILICQIVRHAARFINFVWLSRKVGGRSRTEGRVFSDISIRDYTANSVNVEISVSLIFSIG